MSDEKRCTCEEDASNLGSPPCAKCFIGEPTGEPVGMHFYTVEHWPEMATLMLTDRPEPSYPSHRGGPGRKLARVTPVTLVEGHTHPPKPVAEAGECREAMERVVSKLRAIKATAEAAGPDHWTNPGAAERRSLDLGMILNMANQGIETATAILAGDAKGGEK